MKQLFLFSIFSIFVLVSCSTDQPDRTFIKNSEQSNTRGIPKASKEQKLMRAVKKHIELEINSGKLYKEAFPGYEFGMSEKRITRQNKRLLRKGNTERYRKAKKHTYAYAYLMPLVDDEIPAFVNFKYNKDGKMYKGDAIIDIPKGSSSTDILNLTTDLFKEWFGAPAFDLPTYNYCARHIWINGNRLIDLRCEVGGVSFHFYNLVEEIPDLFEINDAIEEDTNYDPPLIKDDAAEGQAIQTR